MLQVTTSPLAWSIAALNFAAVAISVILTAKLGFVRKEKAWIPIFFALLIAYGLSYVSIARAGRIPAVPYERVESIISSTGSIPSIEVRNSIDIIAVGIACGLLIASRRK